MIIPFIQPDEIGTMSGQNSGQTSKNVLISLNDKEISDLRRNGGWISVSRFAQFSGHHERMVKRYCKAKKYANLQKVDEADRRRPYLIHVTALKDEIRDQIVRKIRGEKPMTEDQILNRREAFLERGKAKSYNVEKALLRNSILKVYREFTNVGRGGLIDKKAAFCERYNRGGFLELTEEFKEIGQVHWKTLDRWQKALDEAEGDPWGLATKYGTSKGLYSVSMAEGDVLLKYALQPNSLTYAEIIDYAKKDLVKSGYPITNSDATYYRWLREHLVENAYMHDTMRLGEKALNDRHLPSIARDRDKIDVGDQLVADGHTFNFTMLDPLTGRPKRMTLVMVFDFRSGMPVGWEFSASENTASIASAYRRAIKTLGFVPRLFYVDNGRAFTSKYFTRRPDAARNVLGEREFSGLFERLKPYGFVSCVNALPYHGQSKPIERYFGTMHSFEKRMPTYLGNSIENRVASERRNEKMHRDLRERMMGGAQPDVRTVHKMLVEWVMEYAHRPASKSAFYPGVPPIEVYNESIEKVRASDDFSSRQVKDDELGYLMLGEVPRTIRNCTVKLFGRHFYAPELFGYRSGEKQVIVRYDLFDEALSDQVFVYDSTGTDLLCIARDEVMSGHHPAARLLGTDEDRERLDAATSEKNMISGAARSMAKTLIGKGYYDAIASEDARALPSMRQIEDRQKGVISKTGTDGGLLTPEERDRMNLDLLRREDEMRRQDGDDDEW